MMRHVVCSAVFAAVCASIGLMGCIAVLAIGLISLPRVQSSPKPFASPHFNKRLLEWGCCVLTFGGVASLFFVFSSLPATGRSVLLLSPLFGTFALATVAAGSHSN
jgi:hypothetical protein